MALPSVSRRLLMLSATAAALLWGFGATTAQAASGHDDRPAGAAAAQRSDHVNAHQADTDRPPRGKRCEGADTRCSEGDVKRSTDAARGSRGGSTATAKTSSATKAKAPSAAASVTPTTTVAALTVPTVSTVQPPVLSSVTLAAPIAPVAVVESTSPIRPASLVPSAAAAPLAPEALITGALSLVGVGAMAPLGGIPSHGLDLTALLLVTNLLLAMGTAVAMRSRRNQARVGAL